MPYMITYICDCCKKTSRIIDGEPIPACCGRLMRRYDDVSPPDTKSDDNNGQENSILK